MDDFARVAVMLLHSHPKRVGASVLVVERIALARRRCGAPERTRPYLERIIQVKARGPRDGRIVSAGWHARVPLARHALRLRCRTAGRHSKEQPACTGGSSRSAQRQQPSHWRRQVQRAAAVNP